MIQSAYQNVALIDTSAVIALHDPTEPFHLDARRLFSSASDLLWAVLDVTSHECYTRARYLSTTQSALEHYAFLRSTPEVKLYRFTADDEASALDIVRRYDDQQLSFHDALCAAAMKRLGIAKVFTFDRDFAVLGFIVLPGVLA